MSRAAAVLLALALVSCKQPEGGGAPSAAPSAVIVLPAPTVSSVAPPPTSATATTSTTASAPAVEAGAPSGPIVWKLTVEPALTLKMSELVRFKLWIVATNHGTKPEDTKRDALELNVNGTPSFSFGLSFGNGLRERGWSALPPGATLREARDLGDALFPGPGSYTLDLRFGGASVSTLQVRVVP